MSTLRKVSYANKILALLTSVEQLARHTHPSSCPCKDDRTEMLIADVARATNDALPLYVSME